jgi:uncharacterized FlgJ-related protein
MKKLFIAGLISASFHSFAETTIINEVFSPGDTSASAQTLFTETFLIKINRIIDNENQRINQLRNKLLLIKSKNTFNYKDKEFISYLSESYSVNNTSALGLDIEILLNKVDTLPNALIISHIIVESFKDNYKIDNLNYFNKPCIEDNCLIDISSMKYSLLKYSSAYDSIDEYIHNINTNSVFLDFRNQRSIDRERKNNLDSYNYVNYLSVFGGDGFVEKLKLNIDTYQLWKYDN